jgi:hypothetical protein
MQPSTTRTCVSQHTALERVSVLRANIVFSHLSHRSWTNRYSTFITGEFCRSDLEVPT